MVDDDVLDSDKDQENDNADDVISADDEVAERLNDVSRSRGARVAVKQDEARRRDIERQAEERQTAAAWWGKR